MEINYLHLTIFIVYATLLIGWPILSLSALLALRNQPQLAENTKLLWAALIVVIPILGAIAFWLIGRPTKKNSPFAS